MSFREWKEVRLGDLIEIKHGYAFDGKAFSEERLGRPIIVNIGNFDYSGGFRFDSTRVRECVGDYPKEYVLNPGDILLAMTCQTAGGEILGVPAAVPDDGNIYLHNQRLGKVIINEPSEISPDYVYYLCLTSDFRHELFVTATGTKILHTAPKRIENYKFMLPSIDEQVKIAKVLSDIDKRIYTNNRINKNLEETAQAIFKRWFIDFEFPNENGEPYKSSGGEMVESEMGLIPKEWEVGHLSNICEINMGQSPPSDTYNTEGNGLAFYQGVKDFGVKYPTVSTYCSTPKKIAKPLDVLLSVRAPVGDINVAIEICCIGRGVCSLRLKEHENNYLYYLMKANKSYWSKIENGSVFSSINKTDIEKLKTIIPSSDMVQRFNKLIKSTDDKILNNTRENSRLVEIRDSLLLKLMSGEIRVPLKEI